MKKIEMDKSDVIWDKIIIMLFFLLGLTISVVEKDVFLIILISFNIFFRLADFIQILKIKE